MDLIVPDFWWGVLLGAGVAVALLLAAFGIVRRSLVKKVAGLTIPWEYFRELAITGSETPGGKPAFVEIKCIGAGGGGGSGRSTPVQDRVAVRQSPRAFFCKTCEAFYWQGIDLSDVLEFESTDNPEVKRRLQEFIAFYDAEAKKHKETHERPS